MKWFLLLFLIVGVIGDEIKMDEATNKTVTDDSPQKLFDDYWNWTLAFSPETATFVGNHDNDDKLDSHSLESINKHRVAFQRFLDRLHRLEAHTTNESDLLNLALMKRELQTFIRSMDMKAYVFAISNIDGSPSSFEFIIRSQKLDTEEDYRKYINRLAALSRQVEEDIELMKIGLMENRTYHNLSVMAVPKQIDMILTAPENTTHYKPFTYEEMSELIPNQTADELRSAAIKVIKESVQPAYKKLRDFMLNDYAAGLRSNIGIRSIPGGSDYYKYLIQKFTSTNMTPEEVHQMGLKEVDRITQEMEKIVRELGFNESVKEFSERLRKDKTHFFNSSEDVISTSEKMIFERINPLLPKYFWKLPKLNISVNPIPEGLKSGAAGYYFPGTLNGSRPGSFVVNSQDFENLPRYEHLTFTMHEANPGHHLQMAYFQEKEDVPLFRSNSNNYDLFSAYTEGWALYAEYLGLEMGLYKDPYERYGHYSWENFRACRLVVDTGIHYFNWTKEQAVDYMTEHTANSLKGIDNEINRYITWPGQACAYKVGEIKIRELRKKAEKELGSKFDVRDYHEVVLDCGNVSMEILSNCVNKYIDKKKNTN